MESLLANYGSDDEDDEPQEQPPRASLSASLPPPKVEDDAPSIGSTRRTPLFASLPPPKFARGDTWTSHPSVSEDKDERKGSDGAPHKETEENDHAVAKGFSDSAKKGYSGEYKAALSDSVHEAPSARVSMFRALPPPKNSGSSLTSLIPQRSSAASSKQVVKLRPSINMALLQETDDDDGNASPHAKRQAAGGKATGLAAILPKPKNLGSALGSGYASGHQTTLDVGTSVSQPMLRSGYDSCEHATLDAGASDSSLTTELMVHLSHQHVSETLSSYVQHNGSHGSTFRSWEGYGAGGDTQLHPEAAQQNADLSAPYPSSGYAVQEVAEGHHEENSFFTPEAYSQEMVAQETYGTTRASAQDALVDMLMREKRKGGKNAPVNIIEVKQEDLTANKLREDQLKATGIAFGPAYKPLSAGKNKPSKLHRRKHQIGSLYYDMKQKEMELMERRAKGYMTKAETQAKYGW